MSKTLTFDTATLKQQFIEYCRLHKLKVRYVTINESGCVAHVANSFDTLRHALSHFTQIYEICAVRLSIEDCLNTKIVGDFKFEITQS